MSRRKPDHYTDRAKREGFAARSVYKLREIQHRFSILARGQRVLDLGAAPGSWTQYAATIVHPPGSVLAVDLKPIEKATLPAGAEAIVADLTDAADIARIAANGPFDVVLSDAAPSTTGNRIVDSARSETLVEAAFAVADQVLARGGWVVVKLFQGGSQGDLENSIRARYAKVRRIRPKATRKESVETFIVASGRYS